MPDITRPDGEQILFRSSKTGEHSLDQYLEDAEFGERPLADILQGVFDVTTGNVRQGIVEFRLNATTRELESRAGEFGDPDEGFAGTTSTFTSTITLSRTSDDSTGPVFRLGKSRSTVVGNYAAVQASDELGSIIWYGADGTDGNGIVARIRAIASEAHTTTKSLSLIHI